MADITYNDPVTGQVFKLVDQLDGAYAPLVATSGAGGGGGDASAANQTTQITALGALTETAPATDTASSGLNGRLQRIAQRLTSTIALLPAALGAGGGLKVDGSGTSLPVTAAASDTLTGAVAETAPASDTASSGLNGRLQRIAQRITSMIALLPTALGAGGGLKVEGLAAHDAASSGSPQRIGARARSAIMTAVTQDDATDLVALLTGELQIADTPTAAALVAIAPVSTSAVASSLVIKASAGNLYGLSITTGGTAGYLMLFNATSAPADGAVTPVDCWVVAANATLPLEFNPPYRLGTGITAVFSSTGMFSKTASATAFMAGIAM